MERKIYYVHTLQHKVDVDWLCWSTFQQEFLSPQMHHGMPQATLYRLRANNCITCNSLGSDVLNGSKSLAGKQMM